MKRIDTEQAARERLINLAELMSDMAEEDMDGSQQNKRPRSIVPPI